LENFLREDTLDPKDIALSSHLAIHSTYLLITERKDGSSSILMNPERLQLKSRLMTWWKKDGQSEKFRYIERTKHVQDATPALRRGINVPTQFLNKVDGDSFHTALDEENRSILTRSQVLIDEDPSHLSMKSESLLDQFKDTESSHHGHKEEQDEPTISKEKLDTQQSETHKVSNEWWNQNLIIIAEILGVNVSLNQYRNGGLKSEVFTLLNYLIL